MLIWHAVLVSESVVNPSLSSTHYMDFAFVFNHVSYSEDTVVSQCFCFAHNDLGSEELDVSCGFLLADNRHHHPSLFLMLGDDAMHVHFVPLFRHCLDDGFYF